MIRNISISLVSFFVFSCVDERVISQQENPSLVLSVDSITSEYQRKYESEGKVNIGEMSERLYLADSSRPDLAVEYATCLLANAKVDNAKYLCRKAINIDSTYSQAYWNLGICYMFTHRDSGYFYFNKAIEKNPNWYYYYWLSRYHEEDSLYKAAVEDISIAIQKNPRNHDLKVFRAKYKNFVNDFQGALDDLRVIPEHRKNDPDVYNILAVSYNSLEQYDKSVENCDKGLSISPDNVYLLYYRAVAKSNMDKPYEALEDLKRCADLGMPQCKYYYEKLSQVLKTKKTL